MVRGGAAWRWGTRRTAAAWLCTPVRPHPCNLLPIGRGKLENCCLVLLRRLSRSPVSTIVLYLAAADHSGGGRLLPVVPAGPRLGAVALRAPGHHLHSVVAAQAHDVRGSGDGLRGGAGDARPRYVKGRVCACTWRVVQKHHPLCHTECHSEKSAPTTVPPLSVVAERGRERERERARFEIETCARHLTFFYNATSATTYNDNPQTAVLGPLTAPQTPR